MPIPATAARQGWSVLVQRRGAGNYEGGRNRAVGRRQAGGIASSRSVQVSRYLSDQSVAVCDQSTDLGRGCEPVNLGSEKSKIEFFLPGAGCGRGRASVLRFR